MEHRALSDQQAQTLIAYCCMSDIDCMVRPPTLEKTRLYRYLEDGATGLMIPHVSTAEKAAMLADAAKFPPLGDRGLDAAGLDADYYVDPSEAYTDEANRETFLIVQIETPLAVENIEAIAGTPGVDGMFVGPADLGLRLNRLKSRLCLDEALRRVAQAAARGGKAWGCPTPTVEGIRSLRAMGAQLIAYGGDFPAMAQSLEGWSRDWDSAGS